MLMIAGGERPPRPTHPALTDALWSLTQRCWDQDALRRPQGLQILRSLYVLKKCVFVGLAGFSRVTGFQRGNA